MEQLHIEWESYNLSREELVFENSGKIFTSRGDVLKKGTVFRLNKTDSPDAKLIADFMNEIRFDIHARGKSFLRDRNPIKMYFHKRASLASGLQQVISLSKDANELCNRLFLILQERQPGNNTK